MSPTIKRCSEVTSEERLLLREVLNRIGDKWSVQIVAQMHEGPMRFNQLKREIDGISQRMLTLSLKALERDGLIRRTVHPTVPPRVEYCLTPLGLTLLGPIMALGEWAEKNRNSIRAARVRYDKRFEAQKP